MKSKITIATAALFVFIFSGLSAMSVSAQSALDGFDPNADGIVRAIVVQPDGKILIGGDFITVSGVTRNRIARLNPDGTLDTGFDPNANAVVNAIAVQPDGKILIGGEFTTIGGLSRNYIARLNTDGTRDTTFSPPVNNLVRSIAVQSNGKILLAGIFDQIGGTLRRGIARVNADGTLDYAFDPNAFGGGVNTIAIQPNGKILIGGSFQTVATVLRPLIARVNADGTLDTAFNANAAFGGGTVNSIVVQPDGKIVAGGDFSVINGLLRFRIARLDATTGLADSWDPNVDFIVYSIAVQADGNILVGGGFSNIGGQTRSSIARLDSITGLADSFNPNAGSNVFSIAVQPDGKILAGGQFSTIGGQTRNRIARLERDGRADQTLINNDTAIGTAVYATAIQPDGKILIGGDFLTILGVARNRIARLNPDGTLDTFNPNANGIVRSIAVQPDGKVLIGGDFTNINGFSRTSIARLDGATGITDSFNPTLSNPTANARVNSIALQSDGKILIGGDFTNINGQSRNHIARLVGTGSTDSFNPQAGGIVNSIVVQSDGNILVGGDFPTIGGQPRNYIARLDALTGLADSWNPNATSKVFSIAVQSDGKILVGGRFNTIGNQSRSSIARLDSTTGLADSWNPNASHDVYSIAVQSDGKVLIGGRFTVIGGQLRVCIARLDGTTGLADSWNPNSEYYVYSIAVQSDGKILVGGGFHNIGGQGRFFIAHLSNDTAALSNLAVTRTTLKLTRDGSAPQFTRVIFEQSIDNGANWTLLGTATNSFASIIGNNKSENPFAPNAAGYTLGGQNIPTGQNVLIRARGSQSGSQTIEDKVRLAFIPLVPTAAESSVSGRVTTASGRGIRNVVVQINGGNLGETRYARTNPFGYYRFSGLDSGQTYVLSVSSKRYSFANPTRVITLDEDLTGEDFVSDSK